MFVITQQAGVVTLGLQGVISSVLVFLFILSETGQYFRWDRLLQLKCAIQTNWGLIKTAERLS
jgi:hypothetical protein